MGYARSSNHAAGEENGSIMVGMFVSLCLASKKSSEREFFVPAGMHLGVKLLRTLGLEHIFGLAFFIKSKNLCCRARKATLMY